MTYDANDRAVERSHEVVKSVAVSIDARELEHLALDVREHVFKSPPDRIRQVLGEIVVRHPEVMAAYDYAHWLVYEPTRTRTKGMLVVGGNGSGKSTLGRLIQRTLMPNVREDDQRAVFISMTGARTTRAVYGRILEATHGPLRTSQRTPDRELAVMRVLRAIGCRMLILDEIQDILAGSSAEQRRALDAVKFLMNQLSLPIVALGVQQAERAFASDPHLAHRFTTFRLAPWRADNALRDLLANIEPRLALKRRSELSSEGAVKYLAKASDGVLDGIMTMVRNAAARAIMTGEERITLELLMDTTLPTAEELRCVR